MYMGSETEIVTFFLSFFKIDHGADVNVLSANEKEDGFATPLTMTARYEEIIIYPRVRFKG